MAMSAAQLNVRIQTEGAAAAKRDINDVGDAVDNSAAKSRMLGTGFLAMGTAIAGGFGYGVTQAISFGEQMANVNSIAQLSTAELAALSDEVIALGSASGQSPQVLAAGLYDIASSGFAGADGMQVLEASSRAATAGMTTTDVAARGVTAALNAYGLGADDAAHISDVMFQTVNEGVITFEQLSNNMGNTLPLAKALGVSFEELGAGYAQMTLSGVGASQAETQIAALMRAAVNPTTELTAAVQAHGYASVESLIATEGLTGYLDLLTQASGGTSEGLFELLGTAEATNAALLLGGENADEYAAAVERMEKSSEGLGATQTALNKQMESTAFSLRLLKTNVQAAAIAIGVQLEPGIRAVAKAMTAGLKLFLNLSKPVQKIIGVITALAGVLALASGAWILFGSQITMAAGLFLSILGPIALVAAAAVGLYLAWKTNFLGIRTLVDNAAEPFRRFTEIVTAAFSNLKKQTNTFSAMLGAVSLALRGMTGGRNIGWINTIADGLDRAAQFVDGFKRAWDDLGSSASPVMDMISRWGGLDNLSVMDRINAWGGLTKEMTLAERAIGALDIATGGLVTRIREMSALDFAIAIGDIAVSIGGWVISAAVDVATAVYNWITPQLGSFVRAIPSVALTIGRWVVSSLQSIWSAISNFVMGGGADAGLSGDGTGGARPAGEYSIGEVAVRIGGWIVSAAANLYDVVKPWVDAAISAVSGIVQQIPSVVVSVGSWIMEAGANLYDVVEPWIEGAVGAASGIIHSIPSVAISVGAWVMRAGANLYDVVQPWIEAAVGAVSGITHSIPEVAASIGAWVMRAGANLYDVVGPWIEAAVGAVSGIVHSIPEVAISIGQWIKGEWKDLYTWVQQNVALSWVGNEGTPFDLGTVSIKISSFDGSVDFAALYSKVNEWFKVSTALDESQLSGIEDFGNNLGRKAMELLIRGVKEAFSGGGGDGANRPGSVASGASGGDAASGADALYVAVGRLFQSIFNGMGDVFSEQVAPLLQAKADEIIAGVQEWWSGLPGKIFGAFSSGGGMESAPGGMRAIGGGDGIIGKALQGLSDSIGEALQDWSDSIGDLFTDLSWPDFSLPDFPTITMPDINWPDPPSIPDWIKDPGKWVQDQISGSTQTATAPAGGRPGTGGGNHYRSLRPENIPGLMDAARQSASAEISITITADNSAAMRAIGDVTAGLAGLAAMAAAVVITADNSAAMLAIGNITAGLAGMAMMATSVIITADNAAAMQAIGDVTAGLFGLSSMVSSVVITGNNAAAMQSIGDVSAGMAGINGMSSLVVLLGDNGAAMRSIGDVSAGMAGIDGMTSTIYIKGDNSSAMAAINAVAAYNGRSLGSATFTVNTVTTTSPMTAGARLGSGLLKGWDRATGTNSPSTEMKKRGQYLYQGLDMGWSGSASNLPIGFDVANPAYARTAPSGSSADAASTMVVNHYIDGDLTSEGNLASEGSLMGGLFSQGIEAGILDGAGGVAGSAVSVVSNAIGAAKRAAGIASPSKEMVPVGLFMDDGLAKGILDGEWKVVAAATQVARAAVAASQKTMNSGGGGIVPSTGAWRSGRTRDVLDEYFRINEGGGRAGWDFGNDMLVEMSSSIRGSVARMGRQLAQDGYISGVNLGGGITNGVMKSLGIHSPSRVLMQMGSYAAEGFTQGFAGAYDSPVLDFTSRAPQLPSTTGSGSLASTGASGNNAPTYNVYVTVEGNVTSERALTATITREIANGIRSDLIRHRTASGVAS